MRNAVPAGYSFLILHSIHKAVISLLPWRVHILQSELMTILAKAVSASRCGHDKARLIAI